MKMDTIRVYTPERKQLLPVPLLPFLTAPRLRYLSALFVVCILLVPVFFTNLKTEMTLRESQRYESLWDGLKISAYQYMLRYSNAEGISQVKIRVSPETRFSQMLVIFGDLPDCIGEFTTVGKLYDAVEKHVELFQGYGFDVEFNETCGFPELIKQDYLRRSNEYFEVRITDFKILD